ncbi:MAG TPA: hypothetical protein O0X27_03760 [Methanocorpusculum sp.]|nr:hypothetical protein [Methanocorpusculum sp.]
MNDSKSDTQIFWAFGEKSRYAHAYCGKKSLEAGITLCGIRCVPVLILNEWDVTDERMREASCPQCLERLPFARFITLGPMTGRKTRPSPDD